MWGRLAACGRLAIGPIAWKQKGAGWQPARRMPSCPTWGVKSTKHENLNYEEGPRKAPYE
jgi:hypothetical protein